jgi:integrase
MTELQQTRYSENTLRAYNADWKAFAAWCGTKNLPALPAHPETVALHITDQLSKLKLSTLERRLAAIRWKHLEAGAAPPASRIVQTIVAGARRRNRDGVKRMAAISPDQLALILDHVSGEDDFRAKPHRAARDRAAITLGFAGAFRRSELCGLDLRDVEISDSATQITLRASKTDQHGRGRVLTIPRAKRAKLCTVRRLRDWLRVRGTKPGPLFCEINKSDELITHEQMQTHSLYYAIKSAAERAGLDATRIGAHSLRAGAATAAANSGADVWQIMELTGHRSAETVSKYIRRTTQRYPISV